MTAVMSKAEFWPLTLVAELWYPVGLLAAEYLGEILNTEQVHGLSHAELAEAMTGGKVIFPKTSTVMRTGPERID